VRCCVTARTPDRRLARGVCNESTSIGLARAARRSSRWPCADAEERSQDIRVELQAIVAEMALADAVGR